MRYKNIAISATFAVVAASLGGWGVAAADPDGFTEHGEHGDFKDRNAFTLSSPDVPSHSFFDTKFILNGFGCTGGNISPALQWKNAPPGTQSFSLQLYDPDAPTGSGFWHWAVYNIPANVSGLPQGAGNSPATLPANSHGGNTDFMDTGATGINGNYGGPCPPVGDRPHRYIFTLFALDVPNLEAAAGIPPSGTAGLHGFALNKGIGAHLLGTASFTAYYGR
jgi:Raf kinase inhibitor-like YbhB/YbcL family protein